MQYQHQGQHEPHDPVQERQPSFIGLAGKVIQCVARGGQPQKNTLHGQAAGAIFFEPPSVPGMHRQYRAQRDQRGETHQAVQPQPPDFQGMGSHAECAGHAQEIMEGEP